MRRLATSTITILIFTAAAGLAAAATLASVGTPSVNIGGPVAAGGAICYPVTASNLGDGVTPDGANSFDIVLGWDASVLTYESATTGPAFTALADCGFSMFISGELTGVDGKRYRSFGGACTAGAGPETAVTGNAELFTACFSGSAYNVCGDDGTGLFGTDLGLSAVRNTRPGGGLQTLTPDVDLTCDQTPLAVTLADFSATCQSGLPLLAWETTSEVGNVGFNILRGETAAAPETQVAFVPSQGPGSQQGFLYIWLDEEAPPNSNAYYWLEDVDVAGNTTRHGPVDAACGAPTSVTLSDLSAASRPTPLWPVLLIPLVLAMLAAAEWFSRRTA